MEFGLWGNLSSFWDESLRIFDMKGRMGFRSYKETYLLLAFLMGDIPSWSGLKDAQKCVPIRFSEASLSLCNFLCHLLKALAIVTWSQAAVSGPRTIFLSANLGHCKLSYIHAEPLVQCAYFRASNGKLGKYPLFPTLPSKKNWYLRSWVM